MSSRLRSWLAGWLFVLCGKLDPAYNVWLDDAPRREPGVSSREYLPGESLRDGLWDEGEGE